MQFRRLRLMSGALIVACTAVPISATALIKSNVLTVLPSPKRKVPAPNRRPQTIRTHDSRLAIIVTGPPGCSASASYGFLGGGFYNIAGYAGGVVSGSYNEACDYFNSASAGSQNVIGGDGSVYYSAVSSGSGNQIEASDGAFIGAGQENLIGKAAPYDSAAYSAIGSGTTNLITAPQSFIGAGYSNQIVAPALTIYNGPSSFIGSGYNNQIASDFAAISGGYSNVLTAEYGTIGGGYTNSVSGAYGAISGGYDNVASGIQASVAGGYGNVASGRNAAIPGGAYNLASGLDSFAAGNASHSTYNGTFVWSDFSATSGVTSAAANQFLARAAGGFYFYSSADLKSGVRLSPGSGSWSSLSDRAAKMKVVAVDSSSVLNRVAALPVSEWSYIEQGASVRHLGPMAQDFRAAFGLGEDDKHISAIDEEGVALAAIKALQAEISAKDRQLAETRQIDEANANKKYAHLEQRINALEISLRSNAEHERQAR